MSNMVVSGSEALKNIASGMPNQANTEIIQCYITDPDVIRIIINHIFKDMGYSESVPALDIESNNESKEDFFNEITKILTKCGIVLSPFIIDEISSRFFENKFGTKAAVLYAFLVYLYNESKESWNVQLIGYTKKLLDCIYDNKPIMISYVNTTANVLPKKKARIAFNGIGKYVSLKYNRDLCVNNGCEYYLPETENLYGMVNYYSKEEYISFINDIEEVFEWDKIL